MARASHGVVFLDRGGGVKLPLASITVGERRRQDFGDIKGLAGSLEKYGLLHPIVVDENGMLVAGERRLRAAQLLGWKSIECHDIGEVSEAWREEIELAENDDRKDLTPYERARSVVTEAKRVAKTISTLGVEKTGVSSPSEETPNRGGRPRVHEAPKADIATAIGVSVGKLVKDEQHVAAAEKYPELQAKEITQKAAIEIAKGLDALPEAERAERRDVLRMVGPKALTLAEGETFPTGKLTDEQRALYDLFEKLLPKLSKWKSLDPQMVADAAAAETVHPLVTQFGGVVDWVMCVFTALKMREERPTLRAVKN